MTTSTESTNTLQFPLAPLVANTIVARVMAELAPKTVTQKETKTETGGRKHFGSKFDRNRSTKDCAVCIRADIKAAIKAGTLPTGKYSVTMKSYSGGSSIDVRISGLPFVVLNRKRVAFDVQHPHVHMSNGQMSQYTQLGKDVLSIVQKIVGAYNRDESDTMTDYFSVHFYSNVTLDWEWTNAQRKAMEAQEKEDPSYEFTLDEHKQLRTTKDLKYVQGACPVPPTPEGMDHTTWLVMNNCD